MIYAVCSAYPAGCTFLDWSLQWLSGQSRFWHSAQQRYLDLAHDPLQHTNAHAHAKNHPCGVSDTVATIRDLADHPAAVQGFYPYAHDADWHAERLGLDISRLDSDQWHRVQQHQAQELHAVLNACQDRSVHMIYVNVAARWQLSFLKTRQMSPWLSHHADWHGALSERHHIDPDLDAWDWREQLALAVRPWNRPWQDVYIDQTRPHVWLEAEDLWFDGQRIIPQLLQHWNLAVDQDRMTEWIPIWHRWHSMQIASLRFGWQLPTVLDAILQGWNRDLPRMDIIEEAVVQHCLIYAHDLNIQNWQLDRFPASARDLHALLEPNQHSIADIKYRDLLRRSIDSLRSSM